MAQTQQFFAVSSSVFGGVPGAIAGCTTIDSDNNDNGFLGCARGQNPGAGLHGSTAEAVARLLQCLGGGIGRANIVGHGDAGIVVTGTGDEAVDPDRYVAWWNQNFWEPHLRQLRGRVNSLSFWACHPGAEDAGADFLFNVAQVINAPAAGPTGFIYCGGGQPDLFLEPGAVWQVATPTQRPNPIPRPSRVFFRREAVDLQLNYGGQMETIPLDAVISVEFTPGKRANIAPLFSISDDNARSFLELVQFDEPFQPGGIPAALVTGRLVMTFVRNDQQEQREFIIYNQLLLQDTSAPDTFYYCHDGFRNALLIMR